MWSVNGSAKAFESSKFLRNFISNLTFRFENFENHKFECNFESYLQWNLSTADMLYSGPISIADTFTRNQLFQATVKLLYFEPLYSGHLTIADTFSENQWCLLLRGFTVVRLPLFLMGESDFSKISNRELKIC